MPGFRRDATALLVTAMVAAVPARAAAEEDEPAFLRDRGSGVATSMFGTYVRGRELLLYPFFEWYADSNYEYKPSELGYGVDVDYRGRYRATEGLLFLGYGITNDLALELEVAVIQARLEKAADDPSAQPAVVEESGLGDTQAQVRWRFLREDVGRPEGFAYFETVFPLQKHRQLIGTRDWEYKLGFGVTKGFGFGTMTLRAAVEYSREEGKFEAGEYAIEYLRRLSRSWRIVALVEGVQLDEVELITEAQWHFHRRAFLKLNMGWGLTPNATDFAPEVGVMLSF
ncbi:MAG TPA: hypothetical protein VFL83_06215 [Anaeromyxobacter sp.]|nr:hypothetical protein [Anaeromyxobacter sp.]